MDYPEATTTLTPTGFFDGNLLGAPLPASRQAKSWDSKSLPDQGL